MDAKDSVFVRNIADCFCCCFLDGIQCGVQLMLINWTETEWLLMSAGGQGEAFWVNTFSIPPIPYPTVEALLCWWIVGMLVLVAMMCKWSIDTNMNWSAHTRKWSIWPFVTVPFVTVPYLIYCRLIK